MCLGVEQTFTPLIKYYCLNPFSTSGNKCKMELEKPGPLLTSQTVAVYARSQSYRVYSMLLLFHHVSHLFSGGLHGKKNLISIS